MEKTRQERYDLIYGNTARKMEAAPSYEPKRKKKKAPRRTRPEASPQTRENQKRALDFDFAFVRTLSAALAVVVAVSFFYLSERAEFLNQQTVLAQKKAQLNTLQVENEDLNLEIEQSINLTDIVAKAKKYGMKKPGADKIIHYSSKDAEYVRQYGEIPKAD